MSDDYALDPVPVFLRDVVALADVGITHRRDEDAALEVERRLLAPPRRRWVPDWTRHRIGLLAVVGALATTGAATAATGLWRPLMGDDHVGRPSVTADAPPREQLDRFGVLRRAPTAADRGSASRRALRWFGGSYRGVRTDAIRLLPAVDGRTHVLVPVSERHGAEHPLCLYSPDPAEAGGGGALGCWTTEQVLDGRAVVAEERPAESVPRSDVEAATRAARARGDAAAFVDPGAPPASRSISGLVPDGVARVVWRRGDQTRTARVTDNFYSVAIPIRGDGGKRPAITWQDEAGATVETFDSPL